MVRAGSAVAIGVLLLAVGVSLIFMQYGSTIDRIGMLGVGFVAKTLCSGIFIGNRSVQSLIDGDITDLSRMLVSVDVGFAQKSVRARILFGHYSVTAKYHGSYTGCSVIADIPRYEREDRERFETQQSFPTESSADDTDAGNGLPTNIKSSLQEIVDAEFTREAYDAAHTRALVVAHNGEIVAEGYATKHAPDMSAVTRFIGWSMTKSLTSILVGMRVHEGKLNLDAIVFRNYTLRALLNMADALPIIENYGMFALLPSMLFSHRSMFEAIENYGEQGERSPAGAEGWYYSSPLTNIISDVLRQSFDSTEEYWRYPYEKLFKVIGTSSIVMETDQSGLFLGSSFSYATAQDWAKLGQLLLNRGEWNGKRLLDAEYVDFMFKPTDASGHMYGGQMWCASKKPLAEDAPMHVRYERVSVDYLAAAVPADTCYFAGHEGQLVIVMPSANAVVVRLGHTTGMVAQRDPATWPHFQPTWDVAKFMRDVLNSLST